MFLWIITLSMEFNDFLALYNCSSSDLVKQVINLSKNYIRMIDNMENKIINMHFSLDSLVSVTLLKSITLLPVVAFTVNYKDSFTHFLQKFVRILCV